MQSTCGCFQPLRCVGITKESYLDFPLYKEVGNFTSMLLSQSVLIVCPYIYIYSAWQEIAPCNCSQGLEDPTPDEGAPSFVTTASGRPVHFNGQHPAALASIQNMKTNSSMPEG